MCIRRVLPSFVLLCGIQAAVLVPAMESVHESARDIPAAYEVDVVVLGGTSGAVSAATAAARGGASVFLAAPLPYLGEDLTGTLQLWLEEGESPSTELARQVYHDVRTDSPDPDAYSFTYQTDVPSAEVHKDTSPASRLTDGLWSSAARESVQYNGNVTIVADLEQSRPIRRVRLFAYRRPNAGSPGSAFDVERMTVSVSDDQQNWTPVGSVAATQSTGGEDDPAAIDCLGEAKGRYVRALVEKPASVTRVLLGELEIAGPKSGDESARPLPLSPPRPMHVKKTLDDALLQAGVQYLYSCYATDVLRDAQGEPCGIVMANRAGRQAVLAKVIIDATPKAAVARMAGARFLPSGSSSGTFRRVVIGGAPRFGEGVAVRTVSRAFGDSAPILEYTLSLPVGDGGYAAAMRADQLARTLTYHPDQLYTSDLLFEVPWEFLDSRGPTTDVPEDVDLLPLDALAPAGVNRVFVLSGCAGVARAAAPALSRPVTLMRLGERLGQAVAKQAGLLPKIAGPRLAGQASADRTAPGEVRESLAGLRANQQLPTVPQEARGLEIWGRYDVVVIGGGTGGAPAGIGAARQGAKTLVVEYLYGLGGVGTQGAISSYYWGNRVGFTASVLDGATRWDIEPKMEWYRQQLLEAGAEIWFGAIGCGVVTQGQRVVGAVVATPHGRGVVLAKTVIDATGNADVAAVAGAETLYTDASEFGMQGTGLPGRKLRGSYNNTDFTIVDETDMLDIWHVLVYSKEKYPEAFDHGRLIDTRERRCIVGDFTISLADELNERTYPDSVVRCWSNFDSHGYTVDPLLLLEHPDKEGVAVYVPYRAMLPKGIDGLLTIGLGISAQRDAIPLIRMQADIQNGGYAAGVAAAMAARADVPVRAVDVKQLQRHLVEVGNLPESVLSDRDSYPLPPGRVAEAVDRLPTGKGAGVIVSHAEQALPLIAARYAQAAAADKLAYAKALAVLGHNGGSPTLIAEIKNSSAWDEGWNYRGMGQFGSALSPLDILIVSLGRTRDPKGVPVIAEKAAMLDAESAFSHHRAVGLALETIGDPSAAAPLAALLEKPGMRGHAHIDFQAASAREVPGGVNAVESRRESLRELMLARALFRCGDQDGLGEKILREYAQDLRGHLARHARAVLDE